MNRQTIIARETAISLVINVILSIAFFMLIFGLGAPVRLGDMATDFLPQTFMIALMGSLIPPMLLFRKVSGAARSIFSRSLMIAVVAVVIVGGTVYLLCAGNPDVTLAATTALSLRAAYGAALSLIVTPIALIMLFRAYPELVQ